MSRGTCDNEVASPSRPLTWHIVECFDVHVWHVPFLISSPGFRSTSLPCLPRSGLTVRQTCSRVLEGLNYRGGQEIGTGSRLGSQMCIQGQTAFCILQDAYITGPVRALCELKKGFRAVFITFHKQKTGVPSPPPPAGTYFRYFALLGNPQSRLSEGSGQVAERPKNRYWREVFITFHKQKTGVPPPPAGTHFRCFALLGNP